ncbi:hypothetical protein BO94DRAFT_561226 [Aspergillus sclerotioniger CBS 115572]|uniref:Uncharacterized protein n=1 Tax=Aspergillus sclerotioniger CBS 115572 TaxID=1450535 RepID=A0A317UZI8_9EURO|nr:hypothetical protein BO94DRAFT_561226 [Aspergillus sclerotioniger CBS 115572]PWY67096.1 hypothetical protein BO94DRAFT_561226 [Aspergillus sclerotioniger CBS 115572]
MPAHSLPHIDVSLFSADYVDPPEGVDVTSDYGTPNLLLLYYCRPVSDSDKETMKSLKTDLEAWNAWELAQAESQLNNQMRKGNLPTDDLLESRIKRTDYRAKVISALRERSQSWLSETENRQFTIEVETNEDDMNAKLEDEIQVRLESDERLPDQFDVVLRIINRIIAARRADETQQYQSTHVELKVEEKDNLEIKSISFAVSEAEKKKEDDSVVVKIEYVNYRYQLDRNTWDENKDKAQEMISRGERIRRDMTLEMCVDV